MKNRVQQPLAVALATPSRIRRTAGPPRLGTAMAIAGGFAMALTHSMLAAPSAALLQRSRRRFLLSRTARPLLAIVASLLGVTTTLGTAVAAAAPAHDDRESPQVIGNPPSSVAGDTSQATAAPSDPTPSCSGSPLAGTLWYSWTPAASGDVGVLLQAGPGTVPIAAFYTTDGVGSLVAHACTTGGQATFQFAGGQTYLIMVGQYTGCCSPGPFTLTLSPAEPPPPELSLTGFFAPVDMGGVLNTVKSGATVPLKFRVFDEGVEQTDVDMVASFTTKSVNCASGTGADPVEELSTAGGTTLRYDTTEQQFVQNWKSPKKSGCYAVTVTTVDGSNITALFKLT